MTKNQQRYKEYLGKQQEIRDSKNRVGYTCGIILILIIITTICLMKL